VDYLGGRGRYEQREDCQVGSRNWYEPRRVRTPEGLIDVAVPQVRGTDKPFRSGLLSFLEGNSEVLDRLVTEMYARCLSARDVEDAFTDATGLLISKSAMSEITKAVRQAIDSMNAAIIAATSSAAILGGSSGSSWSGPVRGAGPWVTPMRSLPATVVSTRLEGPLDWPDATVVSGDAVDVVARLKEESEVPLRSHGSLSMNRALMAAGLVDRLQVTLFPVITGQTGVDPIFQDAADFDLQLLETRTLDGHIQELIYRPTLH
jgi:dihydrofolate reductase